MEYIKRQNLDMVLVGDSGAGKSTIFQNLCYQPLDSSPSSPIAPHDASKQEGTLGVNYYVKEITGHDKKTTAKITLWDTPGKEMYINVSEVYIQTARLVLLVFDVGDLRAFNLLDDWITRIRWVNEKTVILHINFSFLGQKKINRIFDQGVPTPFAVVLVRGPSGCNC